VPGRTTAEAYAAFIEPFKTAIACVGQAKIITSPGGTTRSIGLHAWTLNGQDGMPLRGGRVLRATMQYEFLRDEYLEAGPWRCGTRGYIYALEERGGELIGYHWHPSGTSHYKAPHLHLGRPALADSGVISSGSHLPTGRVSFESFVRLLITDLGVPPQRDSWEVDLRLSEGIFELYRSWGTTPPAETSQGTR
jgi:hypothetical protein